MISTSRSLRVPPGPHPSARLEARRATPTGLARALVAGLGLLALYAALSFLNAEHGYLGTDTGGKVATLEMMRERGDSNPDIGYWAAEQDPDAKLHPMWFTGHYGDRYVNVTTLPMVLAARPLYDRWGYRGALVVPMLGAVAAAFAARALARRLDADEWLAFGAVGIASPVLIYALDFWEHSWGVALMGFAVVLALDVRQGARAPWAGLPVGLLFGLAGTMRTEALLYGAWCVVFFGALMLWSTRRVVATAVFGGSALAGVLAPLAANAALERALLGAASRSTRAVGTAQGSAGDLGLRAKEAILTTFGLNISDAALMELVLGGLLVAGVAIGVARAGRYSLDAPTKKIMIAATAIAVLFASRGLRFIPGLLTASPLAAIGVLGVRVQGTRRELGAFALGALPLVWLTQFTGGALPQWGGRYVLVSGFVLAVLGVAEIGRRPRVVLAWALALAVGTTGLGLAWMQRRTHAFDSAMAELAARDDEVLISTSAFLLREGGGYYRADRRWLSVSTKAELDQALELAVGQSATRIALLTVGDEPTDPGPGYLKVGVERIEFFAGLPLTIEVFEPLGA